MTSEWETFGHLLHGTARAWRLKLDERLKPMGLSQAKWRTLLHLSLAGDALTQAEKEGWITRQSSPRDRRCKMVLLGRRAQAVIARINATAAKLRHELLAGIPKPDLENCIRVMTHIRERAEKNDRRQSIARQHAARVFAGHNGQTKRRHSIPGKSVISRRDGGLK
jgi:MarR family transcriptional regulator for hemolysin